MRINEFLSIGLLVLTVVLISIIFAFSPNITGYISHNTEQKTSNFGTYTLKTPFSTHTDYDLEAYQDMGGELPFLTTCIKEGEEIEKCVEHLNTKKKEALQVCVEQVTTQNFNFGECLNQIQEPAEKKEYEWTTYCDEGEKRFFYDFAKYYQDCFDSDDTNCLCEWDYDDENYIRNKKLKGEHLIKFSEGEDSTKINLVNKKGSLKHTITTNQHSTHFPDTFELDYGNDYVSSIEMVFRDPSATWSRPLNFLLYKNDDNGKRVDFVRETATKILQYPGFRTFVEDGRGVPITSSQIRLCQPPPQDTYRFCINQSKKFLGKNDLTGKLEEKQIIIKVAAYIPDPPPPPLKNVNAFDRIKNEKSLIVMWEESGEEDVASYRIYHQQDLGLSPLVIKAEALLKDIKQHATPLSLPLVNLKDDHDLSNIEIQRDLFFRDDQPFCTFKEKNPFTKRCLYKLDQNNEVEIEDNELYKLKFVGEENVFYLYSLPLDPGFNADVLVTAVDKKGSEIRKVEQATTENGQTLGYPIKTGVEVKNDLPLSSQGIVSLYLNLNPIYNSGQQLITYPRSGAPRDHIDGSPPDDFINGYVVYYKKGSSKTKDDEWTLEEFDDTLDSWSIIPNSVTQQDEFVVRLGSTNPQQGEKYHITVIAHDMQNNPQKHLTLKELGTNVMPLTIP